MHDPVDIRRRIERLVARVDRRDDYGQLLARGEVIHRVEDVAHIEAWRADMKRHARADKIKLRTGANDRIVWAALVRAPRAEWKDEVSEYSNLLSGAVPLAVERRHEPSVALRDGDEVICACDRCDALGYAAVADNVIGGALFEDECPREEPARLTGLGMMYAGRLRRR